MPAHECTEAQSRFAAAVLRELLGYVNMRNANGNQPILVSHAWIDGSTFYLVYTAPPSGITWGLTRDTRASILDPIPWPSLDEAVFYYYELDLYEGRMSASFRHPGDPTTILWSGDTGEVDLPKRVSDIPDQYRYTPRPAETPPASDSPTPPDDRVEPRRYYDPSRVPDQSEG